MDRLAPEELYSDNGRSYGCICPTFRLSLPAFSTQLLGLDPFHPTYTAAAISLTKAFQDTRLIAELEEQIVFKYSRHHSTLQLTVRPWQYLVS